MTLIFNKEDGADAGAKTENTAAFFSARRPESTVLSLRFNTTSPKAVEHPWRYFIAGGESLAKIEQVMKDAHDIDATFGALAKEVGADRFEQGYFFFKNAEVEPVPPSLRLRYKKREGFVSDAAAPADFFPDITGTALKNEMADIAALAPAEAAAAYAALAKECGAESCDGKFFHFKDWEHDVETVPARHGKRFRLKSNPVFIQERSGDAFSVDQDQEAGFEIARKKAEITRHVYPEARFNDWLRSFEVNISLSGRRESEQSHAEIEKLGEEWIIKVPVMTAGIFGDDGKGGVRSGEKEGWVLPPGAAPIKISAYYAKLEDSGSLRSLPKAGPEPA